MKLSWAVKQKIFFFLIGFFFPCLQSFKVNCFNFFPNLIVYYSILFFFFIKELLSLLNELYPHTSGIHSCFNHFNLSYPFLYTFLWSFIIRKFVIEERSPIIIKSSNSLLFESWKTLVVNEFYYFIIYFYFSVDIYFIVLD